MRSTLRALGVTLLASALVTGPLLPSAGAEEAKAQSPKILRVGVTQEVDSLNPFISITRTGTDIGRANFDFLTAYSQQDFSTEPGLAESWSTSDDKLTWTFKIRKGVKWSDGQPLTAKDPAFTFQKMMDDETARTANGSFVSQFESVKATDDTTLVIKTKVPQSTMLALDVPIVPEHVWSKVSDIGAEPQYPIVGTGPFYVTDFKEAQYTKLKANPHYWRGKPKIDELQFIYYRNADAAVTALQSGQVDLINRLTPTQFDALKNSPDVATNNAQNRRFNEIVINPGAATNDGTPIGTGNPALKDVKLRRAIAQAIDSKTLVDKVWGGYAEEAKGYIPPAFKDYAWDPGAKKRKFDLEAANKALDEAGYKKGGDGVRLDKQGKPLDLKVLTHAENVVDENAGPYIKSWLEDIGLKITLQPMSDTQINEATTRGEFDLAFSGWSANPDPDYVLSLQTCANRPNAEGKGGTPDSFFCDKTYDDLYKKQLSEMDPAKRADIVKQMQQRLYDQVPLVILGYENALEAYNKKAFEGFPLQPTKGVIMNQQGFWGYYGATPRGMGPVPVFGKNGENTATGADTTNAAAEDSGSNTGLILGIIGGVVVILLVGGFFIARNRRKTADERE